MTRPAPSLAERLDEAWYFCASIRGYLDDAGYPNNGDALNKIEEVQNAIAAAAELARRVKGSRAATLSRADVDALDLPDTWSGKRVRLVVCDD